jgi:hypothetical protein
MRESKRYNLDFKKACVQKMLNRGHKTTSMIGNECGVTTSLPKFSNLHGVLKTFT